MVLHECPYTLADLREIEQRPENADKTFKLINGETLYRNPLRNEEATIMQEMIKAANIPRFIRKNNP